MILQCCDTAFYAEKGKGKSQILSSQNFAKYTGLEHIESHSVRLMSGEMGHKHEGVLNFRLRGVFKCEHL